ncbi:hypothetical protein D9M72_466270 [compost metagenome]
MAEGGKEHAHDRRKHDLVGNAGETVRRRIGTGVRKAEVPADHHHRRLESDEIGNLRPHHAETEPAERQNAAWGKDQPRHIAGHSIETG